MTRARFETRPRSKRLMPIAPNGMAKMSARRGRTPIRPSTKVPANAMTA